jgi:hypothetical protein
MENSAPAGGFVSTAAREGTNKVLAFSPLLLFAWEYYVSENFFGSIVTCTRDFLWPIAAVTAKGFNASPF